MNWLSKNVSRLEGERAPGVSKSIKEPVPGFDPRSGQLPSSGEGRIVDREGSRTTQTQLNALCAKHFNWLHFKCENPQCGPKIDFLFKENTFVLLLSGAC